MREVYDLNVEKFLEDWKKEGYEAIERLPYSLGFQVYNGYCDPREGSIEDKPVLEGDWNLLSNEAYDRLEEVFDLEWSSSGCSCCGCGNYVRTQVDDMSFSPFYLYSEGGIYCGNCLDGTEVISSGEMDYRSNQTSQNLLRRFLGFNFSTKEIDLEKLPEGFEQIPTPEKMKYANSDQLVAMLEDLGWEKIHLLYIGYCHQNDYSSEWIAIGHNWKAINGRIEGPITTENSDICRGDILIAHYLFYRDFYDGMSDPFYARMCRIQKLDPWVRGWDLSDLMNEEPVMREIYIRLCEKNGEEVPQEVRRVENVC